MLCYKTLHMKRIVKNELIRILQLNRQLVQTNNLSDSIKTIINTNVDIANTDNENREQCENHDNMIPEIIPKEIEIEPLKYINGSEEINCSDSSLPFGGLCNDPIVNVFIVDAVKQWFLKYRNLLSQSAVNELLSILQVVHPQFPKDTREVFYKHHSCPYELKNVPPGFYSHIGIENGLRRIINKSFNMQKYLIQNAEITS